MFALHESHIAIIYPYCSSVNHSVGVFIGDVCEGKDSDKCSQQFCIGKEQQGGKYLNCIPADELGCSSRVVAGDNHNGHYQPDVEWEQELPLGEGVEIHSFIKTNLYPNIQVYPGNEH